MLSRKGAIHRSQRYGLACGDREEGAMQNSPDTNSSPLDVKKTPGVISA